MAGWSSRLVDTSASAQLGKSIFILLSLAVTTLKSRHGKADPSRALQHFKSTGTVLQERLALHLVHRR